MNGTQGTKKTGGKWHRILDAVVTIIKYKKSTIDPAIYIKVLYDGTVSYLKVHTYDVFNTNYNETEFTEF